MSHISQRAVIIQNPLDLAQEQVDALMARCTRVVVPVDEVPLLLRSNCFACGGIMDAGISMRLDGTEMAWVNICAGHRDVPVRFLVSS